MNNNEEPLLSFLAPNAVSRDLPLNQNASPGNVRAHQDSHWDDHENTHYDTNSADTRSSAVLAGGESGSSAVMHEDLRAALAASLNDSAPVTGTSNGVVAPVENHTDLHNDGHTDSHCDQ